MGNQIFKCLSVGQRAPIFSSSSEIFTFYFKTALKINFGHWEVIKLKLYVQICICVFFVWPLPEVQLILKAVLKWEGQ